ncbi:gamma-type small acid-soluble spore protein [Pseudobacillus badius]|uniref:gamma-type small acid-soluble spore protein n=1 Tax=Bacillus badius TaxID=1455 RepID=UPI000AEAA256|nr:small acid-soluble spore protein E (minor gamma-type SASP) [Bacillus badius]
MMANNRQKTQAGTDVNEVKRRNAASAAGQNAEFGTEFGAETDAQQVRQQNTQSEARKGRAPRNQ